MTEAKNDRCELTGVTFKQHWDGEDNSYLIAYGTVVSDPKGRFYVGDNIHTSIVKEVHIGLSENWFQTLNTKYYIV